MANGAPNPVFDFNARNMLTRLAEWYLPVRSLDADKPVYDIVPFLENFFSAFDQDPPRIYAGGPFSGRHPVPGDPAPPNNFSESLPLTRYQRLAWKLRLGGPAMLQDEPFAILSDELKNNYTGLIEIITSGLRDAVRLDGDFPTQPRMPDQLLDAAGPDFRLAFPGLVADAAFSAPEYGGNHTAWQEIYYAGDSQPRGYSPDEVIKPDAGPDPFPIHTLADVFLWIATVFQNGKEFK